jgi:hypothetical protein
MKMKSGNVQRRNKNPLSKSIMQTSPPTLEELIHKLRSFTTDRQMYIDCFGAELYNDHYDKAVLELLDKTDALLKTQKAAKVSVSVVREVVMLANLWPALSSELKLLLLTVAKLVAQPGLQNLCRWLLESEDSEVPLFIEVMHEIQRQQLPPAASKVLYADHDSVMVSIDNDRTTREKVAKTVAAAQTLNLPTLTVPNTISEVHAFGETVTQAELSRFHNAGKTQEGGFDRLQAVLNACPSVPPIKPTIEAEELAPVKIPKVKSQTYVERVKCQIAVMVDGVEQCCSGNAVMTFPQQNSTTPVATCNYHKKFVLQNNPRDPKTRSCRIDESTPAKLYVEKTIKEEVPSCEMRMNLGTCGEVENLTTIMGVTLCPKHGGVASRPGLAVIKEEMERCQMTIERSGPMGERKRDERCSNKATKSFPGMTDSPADIIDVCAHHDHMIRAFNRLDPATGGYKIGYNTTIKLYRYDENWDSKLPCEFTVKIHDGSILGCQHHGDFPTGNGKRYCKHHSWLITANGLKACQPPPAK